MPPEGKSKGKSRKTSKVRKKKTTPKEKEKTLTIPRLDQPARGMDKMPSNAPTMAIAPSDYEHIFHEGPAAAVTADRENERQKSPSPQQPASPPPATRPQPMFGAPDFGQPPQGQSIQATNDIQVTPDGYTYLGQQPIDPSNSAAASRRTALPPHVVRANNQFSRAALARVAKYLASRGEGY